MSQDLINNMQKVASADSVRASNAALMEYMKTAGDGSLPEFKKAVEDYSNLGTYFSEQRFSGKIEKTAATEANTPFIKLFYREPGLTRKVLPPRTITADNIMNFATETTEMPTILIFIENNIGPAVRLPSNKGSDAEVFYSNRLRVGFQVISTLHFYKNIDELSTNVKDYRAIVEENSLKDMPKCEDAYFFGQVDALAGDTDKYRGFKFSVAPTRDSLVEGQKSISNMQLPMGMGVMNMSTLAEFVKMGRNDVGGDLAQEMFKKGLAGVGELEFFGCSYVPSIKRDIIADDTVYYFSTPEYTGDFAEYSKPQLYISKKGRYIHFHAEEQIAITIVNANAVSKVTYNNAGL